MSEKCVKRCEMCGEEVLRVRRTAKYCSDRCNRMATTLRRKSAPCSIEGCDLPSAQSVARRRVCSNHALIPLRQCAHCGVTFQPQTRSRSAMCSSRCSDRARYQRAKSRHLVVSHECARRKRKQMLESKDSEWLEHHHKTRLRSSLRHRWRKRFGGQEPEAALIDMLVWASQMRQSLGLGGPKRSALIVAAELGREKVTRTPND
jgi:hypothetical protein